METAVALPQEDVQEVCRLTGISKKDPALRQTASLRLERRRLISEKFLSNERPAELGGSEAAKTQRSSPATPLKNTRLLCSARHQIGAGMRAFAAFFAPLIFISSLMALEIQSHTSDPVLNLLLQLNAVQYRNHSTFKEEASKKIMSLNSEDLARMANTARSLGFEIDAGTNARVELYDTLFWLAVNELAARNSDESRRMLGVVRRFSDLQSGDLLRFEEIVNK